MLLYPVDNDEKLYTQKKKFLQDNWNSGYIIAELFALYALRAEKLAKFPVKAALRDGEPIDFVKEFLKKKGIANFDNWSKVYLSRDMVERYIKKDPVMAKYFGQEGMDLSFTYGDSGFSGSLTELLGQYGQTVQTIFMVADPAVKLFKTNPEFYKGFLNSENLWDLAKATYREAMPKIFLNDRDEEPATADGGNFYKAFSSLTIESLPKEFQKSKPEDFIETNGIIAPELRRNSLLQQDACAELYRGMNQGLEDLTGNGPTKHQWQKYLHNLLLVAPHMMNTMNVFNKHKLASEGMRKNFPVADPSCTHDRLTEMRGCMKTTYIEKGR